MTKRPTITCLQNACNSLKYKSERDEFTEFCRRPSRRKWGLFALAGGAVERAAFARQAADRAPTPGRARQSGLVVHLVLLPVVPLCPVGRQEIPNAGASGLDGLTQDISHRVVQAPDSRGASAARHPIGGQARTVQDFVRRDRAHPGDDLLMPEQGLGAPA